MTTTTSNPTTFGAAASQAADAAPAPSWCPSPSAPAGLYGANGWTVSAGLWDLLGEYLTRPTAFGGGPAIIDGVPFEDYTPFSGLDRSGATRLREAVTKAAPDALDDRQNLAPSLGVLLDACEKAEGRMVLSGYGIGPQRSDERVTVEALWVADADLLGLHLPQVHDAACQCCELWRTVRDRYGLDADAMPDEMILRRRPGAPEGEGDMGWWMWWD